MKILFHLHDFSFQNRRNFSRSEPSFLFLDMQMRSFLEGSYAFQLVPVSAALSPILIGMALGGLPLFERIVSGFEMFHFASLLAILVSLAGMVLFTYEVRFGLRRAVWLWPVCLIAGLVFAALCRTYGDFYLAFHAHGI